MKSSLLKSTPIKENDYCFDKNYKSCKVDGLDTNNNIIYKFSSLRRAFIGLSISIDSIVR